MWEADFTDAGAALDEQGVWHQDLAVAAKVATEIRAEILAAHEAGLLSQSGNKLAVRAEDGSRAGVICDKPNVYEADVLVDGQIAAPAVLAMCSTLAELLSCEEELRTLLNTAKPELRLDRLEQAKVQVNTGGGGAFPFHFDLPSTKDARRHLTALLYLTPDWEEGDGGEVQVLPFPFPDQLLAPLDRRLVVFSSTTTMHAVRPYKGRTGRVCVNLWFDGDPAVPFPTPLPAEEYDAKVARIVRVLRQQPQELRAFCKVWYRDAISASFRDAFVPSKALEAAILLHLEEAKEVEKRIAPATLELLHEHCPLEPHVESAAIAGLFEGL